MKKMLHGSAPVLFVADLMRSLDFYCDVLGFNRPYLWGDPPSFAMPDREGYILMLSLQNDPEKIRPKKDIWDVYFWVNDAKSLYESFCEKVAKITQERIYKELYNNLEFIVEDSDGYTLAFGQGVDEEAYYKDNPAN